MSEDSPIWKMGVLTKVRDYKLNFSILLGTTRHKLKQFLLGECDGIGFITLFNRVIKRAKQKVKYGRQFSRFHAGKPKHHHVFRRICNVFA